MNVSVNPTRGEFLPGIQVLRGLASLLVVLTHVNLIMRYPRYFGASPFAIHDTGVFAVTVFFVISGFIIVIVSLDGDLRPRLGVADFAWRRFVRIVPFMWLAILGYTLLVFFGTRSFDPLAFLRSLVLWPVGELKPNVLWSLVHELLFYVLFALAIRIRALIALLLWWFVAPAFYASLLATSGGSAAPSVPWLAELARVWLLGGFSGANLQFGTGFLLGLAWLRRARWLRPTADGGRLGMTLPVAAFFIAALIAERMMAPVAGWERLAGWTALATGIVILGVRARGNGWLTRLGLLFGNASFAIYLTHNGVLLTLLEGTRRIHDRVPLPPFAFFLIYAVVTLIAGVAVHLLVEAPLLRRLAQGRSVAAWQLRKQP